MKRTAGGGVEIALAIWGGEGETVFAFTVFQPAAGAGIMKTNPLLQPWTPMLEPYYLYELEETDGGLRFLLKM